MHGLHLLEIDLIISESNSGTYAVSPIRPYSVVFGLKFVGNVT